MKLGLGLGDLGPNAKVDFETILECERMGYDSVWTAETWGADAVAPLAYIAAKTTRIRLGTDILQLQARSPALVANTMSTIDMLSGGRVAGVGIGVSGPQVIEGWHGVPFGKPIARTREYAQILRKVWAREAPVSFEGQEYHLPLTGPGTTGLGKPLRSILHPRQLPIYVGAIGTNNIRTAAELCDGWIATRLSPKRMGVYRPILEEGFRRAGNGKGYKDFDIAGLARVIVTDDVKEGFAQIKPNLALYIGGMGHRTKNFHNQQVRSYGYVEAAERIQELFLAGHKAEAVEAVPDELCDEISLIGPAARIRERYRDWEDGGVTTMILSLSQSNEQARALMAEITGVAKGAAV